MPLPKHIFDPPFQIVRSSHVVLDVTDLERSLAFYEKILGLIVEDRTSDAAFLRAVEERQHHSLVLRKTAVVGVRTDRLQGRQRRGSRQGRVVLQGARTASCLRRSAVSGPHVAGNRSVWHADRALLQDGEA